MTQSTWDAFAGREHLSPAERQVLHLVEDRDYSTQEVASHRETQETTVKTLLHRARRKTGTAPRLP